MTGSFSTRVLMISTLALPEPKIVPARNQTVWRRSGRALRISPVSIRLRRCSLSLLIPG